MGLGLVGDGVEDFVDLEAEIWLLEIPFTARRETERKGSKEKFSSYEICACKYGTVMTGVIFGHCSLLRTNLSLHFRVKTHV